AHPRHDRAGRPPDRLGAQRLLGVEVLVETAVGEAGGGGDLGDTHAVDAPLANQAGAASTLWSRVWRASSRVRLGSKLEVGSGRSRVAAAPQTPRLFADRRGPEKARRAGRSLVGSFVASVSTPKGDTTMRFMVIVKATKDSEAGV